MKTHELDALARFRERYSVPTSEVDALIEESVLGAAWGANGYTTIDQADELGRRLDLGPDRLLLDVGTGRGWPGLYLAARSGCSLVATDTPLEALRVAARRAHAEMIADRVTIAAAAAEDHPFPPTTFNAIVHADVLC